MVLTCETRVRVRYGETDRMGYAHHANYALYFEEGRTELMRQMGMDYKTMEDNGIILPLSHMSFEFKSPAYYDEVLTIHTKLREMKGVRLTFDYRALNESGKVVCDATTILIFADSKTGHPRRPSDFFKKLLDENEL
jgi:acyl-CoA thioester hydrolase